MSVWSGTVTEPSLGCKREEAFLIVAARQYAPVLVASAVQIIASAAFAYDNVLFAPLLVQVSVSAPVSPYVCMYVCMYE